eukprot:scaffold9589_cov52-Phaeocystis_antarctica.AAC.1
MSRVCGVGRSTLAPPAASACLLTLRTAASTSSGRTGLVYMASAWLRQSPARRVFSALNTGVLDSAPARSKCVAASLSSAAERGPGPQATPPTPLSTNARIACADSSFAAARTTLADSAFSPSSFHHSGLAASAHSSSFSTLKACAEPLRGLHDVPRVDEHCAEVEVRHGLVGPQGDGLAVGLACFAPVLLRAVPRALSHQPRVLVARLRGAPGLPLRGLAIPLLQRPTILRPLPLLPQLLVKRPVQLPSARVRRAVLAAEVRRRQLLIEAFIADGVLLPLVVHV